MASVIEADEKGSLHIPAEMLQTKPRARFEVESSGEQIVLRPIADKRPFWETATPEERIAHLRRWIEQQPSYEDDVHLTDEQLRRENIYD